MQYHNILRDYLRDYALPAMLDLGWAFKAAKSYGWKGAQRPEYQIDQPLRTHILNGLYGLTRLLEYLQARNYYHISDGDFKRALVLYTLHDAYKDNDLARRRTGTSDFSVPLEAIEELLDQTRLRPFVAMKAEDIRAAMVSLLSDKVADFSATTPGTSRLLTLVHLADAFASQQTARDCKTAENRLSEITRHDAVTARQEQRLSTRLGIDTQADETRPALKFYYHELDEYRGLSTLLIHQATEEILSKLGLYPLLYYANGILYVGPEGIVANTDDLCAKVTTLLFTKIRAEAQPRSLSVAKDACDPRKGMKIEKYAYLFCSLQTLFDAVRDVTRSGNVTGFVSKTVTTRVQKKKYAQAAVFYERYGIQQSADESPLQADHWMAATKLVMAAESIAEALVPGDTLEWLLSTFRTPNAIAATIREYAKQLRDGGIADHCIIIAYHWLLQIRFHEGKRTWLEVGVADIQEAATAVALDALKPYNKEDRLLSFAEKELGIQNDARNYLQTTLVFSFDAGRMQDEDPLQEYEKERRRSHKRLCTICNRPITAQLSKKSSEIKTGIADMPALVFSNRRVPSDENKNDMLVWCPMCYLEFMLRKLSGQGYPADSDYNASYRLHLYLLPDYSFTPQLWADTGQDLLQRFHPQQTTVSKLRLRGSKDDPALPAQWLEQRSIDQHWLEQVREMFAKQAELMQMPTKSGRPRSNHGDRLIFSIQQPNYMLITYDNVVSRSADSSLAPTHIEVWAKALYAAILIHLLTGARVYITDKPYLTITRPEQMKTIIEMEGLHPLLYSLFPVQRAEAIDDTQSPTIAESNARLPLACLVTILDLLAAVWEINAALQPGRPDERRNLDKQVAGVLEEVRSNYLAGATLYKMRERAKAAPYSAFTRACQILLPQQADKSDPIRHTLSQEGYELMIDKEGGAMVNLTQQITDTSLKLYLPSTQKEGRAHRYENIFRTGIEVIKTNAGTNDEELVAKVAGNILKRLERISGGATPTYGEARVEAARAFAELIVRRLFRELCHGSISKLTHQENAYADAIYFFTAQQIHARWEQYKQQKAQRAHETNHSSKVSRSESDLPSNIL